jgi:hypothetical protein
LNYLHAISQPKKKKRKHYASIRISTWNAMKCMLFFFEQAG